MWLDRLREMRKANQAIDLHEWSTKKIAIKSGIPKQTLDKIFAGSTMDPKLMTMQKLVYAMGYMLDDLFNDKPLNGPGSTRPRDRYTLSAESFVVAEVYEDSDERDREMIDSVIQTAIKHIAEKKNGTNT